jgi:lipoprotein-anchoring transpeptidase ErfK/SrfK
VSGRLVLSAAVAATATAAVVLLALGRTGAEEEEGATLPAPVRAAFAVPQPTPIASQRHASRWASVLRPVAARSAPGSSAPIVARLRTRTPEGTSNLVLVVSSAEIGGRIWAKVRLPVLPTNMTGWVPRRALGGYRVVQTRLVVDRASMRATLFRGGKPVFRAAVGVGRPQWPTPSGEFYIRNRLREFRSSFYGPLAFGTSARSTVLTDWPAGGFVGIHGTDRPEILPGQVSHGCIRMKNEDILRLGRLMPVGTPLTIT